MRHFYLAGHATSELGLDRQPARSEDSVRPISDVDCPEFVAAKRPLAFDGTAWTLRP